MQSELKTPFVPVQAPIASDLIHQQRHRDGPARDLRHRHEEQALRRLKRETRLTARATIALATRALRLLALLFERVELVRHVAPGVPPLPRDRWETRNDGRILY